MEIKNKETKDQTGLYGKKIIVPMIYEYLMSTRKNVITSFRSWRGYCDR